MFGSHVYLSPTLHFLGCKSNEFMYQYSFLQRMVYIQGAGMVMRAKYYGAWKIAEAACSLTKIAYNGIDPATKQVSFNRAENISILGVELGENPKMLTDSWNKYTNIWLKRTVYSRATIQFRMILTYFSSAFWHGFHRTFELI